MLFRRLAAGEHYNINVDENLVKEVEARYVLPLDGLSVGNCSGPSQSTPEQS